MLKPKDYGRDIIYRFSPTHPPGWRSDCNQTQSRQQQKQQQFKIKSSSSPGASQTFLLPHEYTNTQIHANTQIYKSYTQILKYTSIRYEQQLSRLQAASQTCLLPILDSHTNLTPTTVHASQIYTHQIYMHLKYTCIKYTCIK